MFEGIVGGIIKAILQFTYGKIVEWLRQKDYEKAKQKAENIETYVQTASEAEKATEKYKVAMEERQKVVEQVKTTEDKLAKIRAFNQKPGGGGA